MMSLIMASNNLLEETNILSTMILESELFQEYKVSRQNLLNDIEAQKLIKSFQYKKEQYEEVQRFGKYHPDYHKIAVETRQMKRDLDLHPSIAAFKSAEKALEDLLIEISGIVAHAVSDKIKIPTGNPYFDNLSCSGGCSTGGSCGCK